MYRVPTRKKDYIMLEKLREKAKLHNDRIVMLPIERLYELKRELDDFNDTEELNSFQKWIFTGIFQYDLPEIDFEARSLILVAVPNPLYVNVVLNYQGKKYRTKGVACSIMDTTKEYITSIAKEEGHRVQEIFHFPLKRLAVQSGLATYGRNNITYVDGLGSNVMYTVFVSDAISEEDNWRAMCHAKICDTCKICLTACPTGAIREDRFLIDNEKCLSCINEGDGEFPDWLPKNAHHTLYDCLRCQMTCPMNIATCDKEENRQTIEISEEETQMILDGKGEADFTEEFNKRTAILALFRWSAGLSRNVRAIIESDTSNND